MNGWVLEGGEGGKRGLLRNVGNFANSQTVFFSSY